MNGTNQPEQIVAGNVVAIAAGYSHSLFEKSDGSLWAMGWNDDGQLGDGFASDSLAPEQIFPSPQPVLTTGFSSGTSLQLQATSQFGGTFYLLTSANPALPVSQWTPVWTNFVTARGATNFSVVITNTAAPGAPQFYILQSQ